MLMQPIFIGGLYKSGTTLLRMMLAQHSSLASGLETFWFDLNWDNFESPKNKYDKRRWDGTRDEPPQIQINRLGEFFEIDSKTINGLVCESSSGPQFIDRFLALYAKKRGAKRWVEKTPANILHLKKISSNWPDAKFIHIVRDPLDVFSSLKKVNKWSTPAEFARLWVHFFGGPQRSEIDLKKFSYKVFHYEDLVLNPVKAMRALASFVEIEWQDELGEFAGSSKDYDTVLAISGKASTTLERLRHPITKKRIGIYKNNVSTAEVEIIEKMVSEANLLETFKAAKFLG